MAEIDKDQKTLAKIEPAGRLIVVEQNTQLAAGLIEINNRRVTAQTNPLERIAAPGALEAALNIVYLNPSLVEASLPANLNLDRIRKEFPETIGYLTPEERFSRVVSVAPIFRTRFSAERRALGVELGPEASDILDSELLIRMLSEDGSRRTFDISLEAYLRIISSHDAYGALSDVVLSEGANSDLPPEERQRVLKLGQNLLHRRRLLEVEQNISDGRQKFALGEQDLQGRLAQLRLFGSAITMYQRAGNYSERRGLEDAHRLMIVDLLRDYPQEARHLDYLFGPEEKHVYAYVNEPGAPEFSPAELRDWDRGR